MKIEERKDEVGEVELLERRCGAESSEGTERSGTERSGAEPDRARLLRSDAIDAHTLTLTS